MRKVKRNTEQDFWKNVAMPEDRAGCWLWTGPTKREGYGRLSWAAKTIAAHRISWMLHRGPTDPERFGADADCYNSAVGYCIGAIRAALDKDAI